MRKYLVIYENVPMGTAYVPDLPGRASAGADKREVDKNIVEAIKLS